MTKWNGLLPRTLASTLVQPRVTAISLLPATLTTSRWLKLPLLRVGGGDAGADPGEDHVAHRQAAVDLGVGEQTHAATGAVAGDAVGVGGGLEVELVLDHDGLVEGLLLVQLGEQQREEVVLDLGRFGFAVEHRPQRGRCFAPQRDLLQPDQVGLWLRISFARPLARTGKLVASTWRTISPLASKKACWLVEVIAGVRSAPR